MAREPILIARVASLPFARLDALRAADSMEELERAAALADLVDEEAANLEARLFAAAGPASASPSEGEGGAGGVATAVTRTALLQVRRDVHHRRREAIASAADTLSGGEPDLANRLAHFVSLLDRSVAAAARHRTAHGRALSASAARLIEACRDPLFEEGVRLASRALLEKAERLRGHPFPHWKHRERHTALKLAAYLTRAASKTSPNGVFCATALGKFGDRARCHGDHRVVARDDLLAVGEARKITACLAVDPEFAALVTPRVNPTLSEAEGRWTFWRPASPRRPGDDEVRSSVPVHPVAKPLLELCRPDRRWDEWWSEAHRRTGIARSALEPLVAKMVESGLLIAEVEIPWSERRPLRWLAENARRAGVESPWTARIERLEAAVDSIEPTPWPARAAVFDRIAGEAESMPHRRPIEPDQLIRVDAATGLQVELPRGVLAELERFMAWYVRVYAGLYPRQRFIEAHARRFLATHPADTDVPLLELYHGVFESPGNARPSAFPEPSGSGGDAERARATFARVRERLANEARIARHEGRDEVALDALDWDSILGPERPPRWSCGVLFQVAASNAEAIDAGRYRLALNGLYAGGGLAAARLAHLHAAGARVEDGPIAREVRDGWAWLERDDAVVAELSFMHGGRTANAGLRPSLFRHEIELPGDRATPGREVIPLEDLVVRFESTTRRFRLRWRSRNLDVLPMVASGISPEGWIGFLIAVGQQDLQPLAVFPGVDAAGMSRWPRFRFGRTVVFRRRWIFSAEATPFAASLDAWASGRMVDVARWRDLHELPRHLFAHTDVEPKPSHLDLESPWSIEVLSRRLGETAGTALHFTEMLPSPEELWVEEGNGRYASEFLAHLENVARESRGARA